MRPYISLVIPTLNEAQNLGRLMAQLKRVLKGYRYEILVVDGGAKGPSTDGTVSIAKSMGARVIYDHRGKGSALIKGFAAARGRIIISMDADLSHRPQELPLLIAGIETGYDVCVGSRFLTGGGSSDMPPLRIFGNKVFVSMVNLLYGSRYTDMCYGYRSFTKNAVHKLHLKEDGFGIETEINIKARKSGLRVLEVPSFEKKRDKGVGKLNTVRDGFVILRTILKNF